MSTIRRTLLFTILDSYLGVALQLAGTFVIARLLTPEELGVFAVAAVFAALASTFRDFGVAEYLIQEKELSADKIRAAFAANLLVSWSIAIILVGTSWPVSVFYGQPGIADVMRIQSLSFFLIPIGAVTMACFRRELNYRPIFIANLLANIVSFAVAIGSAMMGLSYLSLAWSSVAGVLVTVLISLYIRPSNIPFWPSFNGVGKVIHFGKHATGIYLFGQIGKSAPEAVIGRVMDMASVAFFSRAGSLNEIFSRLIMRGIMPVCLPYFSQEHRTGNSLSEGYGKAAHLLTGIGWPFFLYAGLMTYSIFRTLYGPQWDASVPLGQILCLVAAIELPYLLAFEALMAKGRVEISHKLQFLIQSIRILSLGLIFPFGLAGACWGLVLAAIVGALIAQGLLHRHLGLSAPYLYKRCLSSIFVAFLTCLPLFLLLSLSQQDESNFLHFFFGGSLLTGASWLASLYVTKHDLWRELTLIARRLIPGEHT